MTLASSEGGNDGEVNLTGVWVTLAIIGPALCCLFTYFIFKCIYDNDDLELKIRGLSAFPKRHNFQKT